MVRLSGAVYRSLCHVTVRRVLQPARAIYNARTYHPKSRPDHTEEKEDDDKPIKFSTSKGSNRRWTVAQSFGSDHRQPLWKSLTVAFLIFAVLLWAVFREETEIDEILYRPIPELLAELERKEKDKKGKEKDKKGEEKDKKGEEKDKK